MNLIKLKSPLQAFHAGIAIGITFITAVAVFFQDLLGLDRWVKFISSNWTDLHWGFGLSFIVLSVGAYLLHYRNLSPERHRR